MSTGASALADGARTLLFGEVDPRLRATWRLLLAVPVLPVIGLLLALLMASLGLSGPIPGGPVQGVLFLGFLLVWARYVDRRPLSDYGVAASAAWLRQLVVGFVAVVAVWACWHVVAASMGWMHVEWAPTAPQGTPWVGVVGMGGSLLVNTWVQDAVFFAIVLATAAQGFRCRGMAPARAVLAGWLVGTVFFTLIHGTPTLGDLAGTAVGGAVFGLLYVHTGSLPLTIGVHWGASYAAGTVFASAAMADSAVSVFRVTAQVAWIESHATAIVLYASTYLLLVGWLWLSGGEVAVETDVARWTRRVPESEAPGDGDGQD